MQPMQEVWTSTVGKAKEQLPNGPTLQLICESHKSAKRAEQDQQMLARQFKQHLKVSDAQLEKDVTVTICLDNGGLRTSLAAVAAQPPSIQLPAQVVLGSNGVVGITLKQPHNWQALLTSKYQLLPRNMRDAAEVPMVVVVSLQRKDSSSVKIDLDIECCKHCSDHVRKLGESCIACDCCGHTWHLGCLGLAKVPATYTCGLCTASGSGALADVGPAAGEAAAAAGGDRRRSKGPRGARTSLGPGGAACSGAATAGASTAGGSTQDMAGTAAGSGAAAGSSGNGAAAAGNAVHPVDDSDPKIEQPRGAGCCAAPQDASATADGTAADAVQPAGHHGSIRTFLEGPSRPGCHQQQRPAPPPPTRRARSSAGGDGPPPPKKPKHHAGKATTNSDALQAARAALLAAEHWRKSTEVAVDTSMGGQQQARRLMEARRRPQSTDTQGCGAAARALTSPATGSTPHVEGRAPVGGGPGAPAALCAAGTSSAPSAAGPGPTSQLSPGNCASDPRADAPGIINHGACGGLQSAMAAGAMDLLGGSQAPAGVLPGSTAGHVGPGGGAPSGSAAAAPTSGDVDAYDDMMRFLAEQKRAHAAQQQDLARAQQEVQQLRQDLVHAQEENAELARRLDEQSSAAARQAAQQAAEGQELQRLLGELQQARQEAQGLAQQLGQQQAATAAQAEAADEEQRKLHDELQRAQQQAQELTAKHEELQVALQQAQTVEQRLRSKLHDTQREAGDLSRQLETQMDQAAGRAQAEELRLKEQLARKMQEAEELARELAKQQAVAAAAEERAGALQRNMEICKKAFRAMGAAFPDLAS